MTTSIFSYPETRPFGSFALGFLRTYTTSDGLYRFTTFSAFVDNADRPSFTVRLRTPLFPEGTGYARIVDLTEGKEVAVDDPYSIFYLERAEADFLANPLFNPAAN